MYGLLKHLYSRNQGSLVEWPSVTRDEFSINGPTANGPRPRGHGPEPGARNVTMINTSIGYGGSLGLPG